ncbi:MULTISPECIES: glycosyltransferase family 4 protein [Bacillota]|uniref:Uncharacterized protein n=1 Tax=Ileibacterium valens TaxID=1862668 RepID=A0A1U7NF37_9FIRM|nr:MULTISPECIES: glycosyltransferase family 4 protein [Bacillota]OLU38475.1 hypothetical protein BM735_09345 [Erysipelotrichaceae bacterium NYU-BL-F16]OLU38510.1 hypothetical protein BO222_08305 [Ileibacterium valens]OLU38824.1 hypothetical protein BO224_08385 [Erysipelotrichaceae bacterium NYU-BL-E8]
MKVLFLLHTTKLDGSSISFINLAKGLSQAGNQIYFAYPDEVIDQSFLARVRPYVYGYYPVSYNLFWKKNDNKYVKAFIKYSLKQIKDFYFLLELKKIVEQIKPDLIHSNSGVIHIGYYLSQITHIPHVWHIREYVVKDFGWKIEPSYSSFVKKLDKSNVITISDDLLIYFKQKNNSKAKRIYNGCLSKKEAKINNQKRNFFLICSRVSKEKGHEEVIRAFSEFIISSPGYRLLIAGAGEENYINYLKDLAKSLGCYHAIDFLGFIADVKPLMLNAKALIVGSIFEGFGRMTAEAYMCGCPVIGRNTGGTKEILEKTGGLVFSNYDQLVQTMRFIVEMSDIEYEEMIQNGYKVAVEKFSIETNTANVISYYKRILDNSKNENQ